MSCVPLKPKKDYIPKDVTQQSQFLYKYPKFDGKGILMAIIDSGIDVSLDGMKTTSAGLPKIIDCFDFTGVGNIDTSTIRDTLINNCLIGLSGRELKIPSKWMNPSGKWHLGIKSVYEHFPKFVIDAVAATQKAKFCEKNKLIREKFAEEKNDKIQEYLKSTEDSLFKDLLIADCIVWFDGQRWQACIDTTFTGDLENAKVLTNFRDGHEYDTLEGNVTYCLNIYNEGNLLEFFTLYSDHGSIVAEIAAAHFPSEPERDGLAPGAQLISMNVLDPRRNGRINKDALIKALHKCIEMGVDIVNYSITGFTKKAHKIIKEMVEKHGIIIFKCGGNDGPVYFSGTSYDAPIMHHIFSIGSILTPKMKKEIHNNDDEDAQTKIYSYSSRGPASDGSHIIDFVAPGSAIACLPRYYKNERKYFSGTSAAAPNAAGAIACLLSALKEHSIQFSPTLLKAVLSKTAYLPENENKLEFGHGIIQIDDAFEYFKTTAKQVNSSIGSRLKLFSTKKEDIFSIELKRIFFFEMVLFPCTSYIVRKLLPKNLIIKLLNVTYKEMKGIVFKKDGKSKPFYIAILNEDNSQFMLELKSSSTDTFVEHSQIENDKFSLTFNSSLLEPGSISYAEIQVSNPSNNSVVTLPLTIIRPLKVDEESYSISKELTFKSGTTHRLFIIPPKSSYYCCIKLTLLHSTSPATNILIHYACQKRDLQPTSSQKKYLCFNSTQKCQSHFIPISYNYQYEIAMVQNECLNNISKYKAEIDFLGIYVTSKTTRNFTLTNYLKPFNGCVFLTFDRISWKLKPTNFEFITEKNFCEQSSKSYLKLIYEFKVSKSTKFSFNVDGNYHFYKAQVFTMSKKCVHHFRYTSYEQSITLPAGSYFVALFVEKKFILLTLPFFVDFSTITVTANLEAVITPTLYSTADKNDESKIAKDKTITLDKNEKYSIHYDFNVPVDQSNSLSPLLTFHGSLNFSYGENKDEISEFKVPFTREHSVDTTVAEQKSCKYVTKKFKDTFNTLLPYSLEFKKLFSLIDINKAIKYEKKIYQLYSINSHEELTTTIDTYFKTAINYKWFIKSCENVEATVSEFEGKIIDRQKNAIIDILFIKADAALDKCLKEDSQNIPIIFKEKFGFEYVNEKLHLEKSFDLPNAVLSFFKKNIFSCVSDKSRNKECETSPKIMVTKETRKANENDLPNGMCQKCLSENLYKDIGSNSCNNNDGITASNMPEICKCSSSNPKLGIPPNSINHFEIIQPQEPTLTESQIQLENACKDFFEYSKEDVIRKDLIQIKKALVFGDFGAAFFYLNKISTDNQTIPDFKFIDLAIIELLKHLGWNHLSEAHQNSLLNRYQN